ncbi:MAG TPA: carbon monoxide dehydrogenase subunit G [Myxococcota bacterium]
MRLEYEHRLHYPREQVWSALVDPQVLARILPGVEKFEAVGADRYDIAVHLGVPAVKGSFRGSIEVAESQFPARYTLRGQGKGATGWVRGGAQITLDACAEGTRVTSAIDAQVGGRIAGVGQRMLEGVARALAQELFEALDREIAGRKATGSRMLFFARVISGWLRAFFERGDRAEPGSRT